MKAADALFPVSICIRRVPHFYFAAIIYSLHVAVKRSGIHLSDGNDFRRVFYLGFTRPPLEAETRSLPFCFSLLRGFLIISLRSKTLELGCHKI